MVAMVNTTDHQFQFNGSTEQLPGGPNNAPDSLPAEVAMQDLSCALVFAVCLSECLFFYNLCVKKFHLGK